MIGLGAGALEGSADGRTIVPTPPAPSGTQELPTPLRIVNVSSVSALNSALSAAQPGDHIVLADGTYDLGGRMQLTRSGTAQAPIVVRAQNVLGARLPGGFEYGASTSHVWLWGLDFKDATTSFLRGANNILRRCRIWPRPNFSADVTGINVESGRNCRIDYCTIRLYTLSEIASLWPGQDWTEGRLYAAVRGHTSNAAGNRFENLVVERCHFVGGINRQNAYSRPYTSLFSNHGGFAEDVQQNLRHAWILRLSRFDSESATNIANHNNSGNVFDRVHIVGNGSGIAKFRYSGWCTMSRCRLENAAFDIMGGYHVCENSIATSWNVFAGTCAWNDVSDGNEYPAAKNVRLSRCSGPVTVGANWGSAHTFPADATRIEAHRFGTITLVSGRETNTVQTAETSTPDLAPITLTASDVGVDAPWVGIDDSGGGGGSAAPFSVVGTAETGTIGSTITVSGVTIDPGVVIVAIAAHRDSGARNVSSITHPALSGSGTLRASRTAVGSGRTAYVWLYEFSVASGATGDLQVTLSGTAWTLAVAVYHAANSQVGSFLAAATAEAIGAATLTASATNSSAQVGLAFASITTVNTGVAVTLSPWSANPVNLSGVNSVVRVVGAGAAGSVSGVTQTWTPSAGNINAGAGAVLLYAGPGS